MHGMNLSGGSTNALAYCQAMFGFPTLTELDAIYDQDVMIYSQ
jgi:ABC-type protease/lipase transport system fused ATPase/permease subunit